jgi:hypothetical protein
MISESHQLADWRNLKACGRILKLFALSGTAITSSELPKRQDPHASVERPFPGFELKSFGRSPPTARRSGMNRTHSASEQDRRSSADGDNS